MARRKQQPEPRQWRNRIIGSGEEDPEQLLANPKNWRLHPTAQQEALEGVLREVGWVQQVIVNRRTGYVVDGHARVAMAISRHEKVPVVYVDLDEREESLILATLDPLSAMAGMDKNLLAGLVADLSVSDSGLQKVLDDLSKNSTSTSDGIKQEITERFQVLVNCSSESQQAELLERLHAEDYECRALIS